MIIRLLWLGFLSTHDNLKQFCTDIYNTGLWSIEYVDNKGWFIRRRSKNRKNDAQQLPKVLTPTRLMAIICYVGTNEDIQDLHNHLLKLGWRFALVRSTEQRKSIYELWQERQ